MSYYFINLHHTLTLRSLDVYVLHLLYLLIEPNLTLELELVSSLVILLVLRDTNSLIYILLSFSSLGMLYSMEQFFLSKPKPVHRISPHSYSQVLLLILQILLILSHTLQKNHSLPLTLSHLFLLVLLLLPHSWNHVLLMLPF